MMGRKESFTSQVKNGASDFAKCGNAGALKEALEREKPKVITLLFDAILGNKLECVNVVLRYAGQQGLFSSLDLESAKIWAQQSHRNIQEVLAVAEQLVQQPMPLFKPQEKYFDNNSVLHIAVMIGTPVTLLNQLVVQGLSLLDENGHDETVVASIIKLRGEEGWKALEDSFGIDDFDIDGKACEKSAYITKEVKAEVERRIMEKDFWAIDNPAIPNEKMSTRSGGWTTKIPQLPWGAPKSPSRMQ